MGYEFINTKINEVVIIKPKVFYDKRGFFMESYTKSEFVKHGIEVDFVQDNHSWSIKNTLRGLHFQKEPYAQAKLVRCISGEILDVAVDIRNNSSTFGEYVKVLLSSENKNMLFIPEGFAHGFLVLSDYAEVIYKVNREYNKEAESGIIWNDMEIGIDWPVNNPLVSEKDMALPSFESLRHKVVK
ncbi:MAG: dTDP-4-dehydrorhamnose 3,5-epimerase [Thermoplasmata archaeon]